MSSPEPLHGASPDQRAECGRCGAITRVARIGRHNRHHEWEDELARRLGVLEQSGGEAELVVFGGEGDVEPAPVPVEDAGRNFSDLR